MRINGTRRPSESTRAKLGLMASFTVGVSIVCSLCRKDNIVNKRKEISDKSSNRKLFSKLKQNAGVAVL